MLPSWVTGDSWYSSLENLKFIRGQKLNFMFGIENNRIVSVERGKYIQIQKFEGWSTDIQTMRFDKIIPHWYDIQKNLFVEVIRNFIAKPGKFQAVNWDTRNI